MYACVEARGTSGPRDHLDGTCLIDRRVLDGLSSWIRGRYRLGLVAERAGC